MDIDRNLSTALRSTGSLPHVIPPASLRRLPQYHHYLVEAASRGITQISCSVIGRDLNCIPVQVRKDLQYTGIVGKPKTGYQVNELIRAIEEFLGWNNVNEAFLVGVGNLGTALLGHERFTSFGLRIVAAFDADPAKLGRTVSGQTVQPFATMAGLARRMTIHLGIITTPASVAQRVADEMIKGGILAIWNFAPVRLRVPAHICVHYEDLYSSLASLSWDLARRLQQAPEAERPESNSTPGTESRL